MKNLLILWVFILLAASCSSPVEKQNDQTALKIKVAVFKGNGGGAVSVTETLEALRIDTGIEASALTAVEIMQGKLSDYDVVIIPGGSGSKQLNNLGKKGKAMLRQFVVEDKK